MQRQQILVPHPERGPVLQTDFDPVADFQDENWPILVQSEGLRSKHVEEYIESLELRATFAIPLVALSPAGCYYHPASDSSIPSQ
jgi:hypothetical protein